MDGTLLQFLLTLGIDILSRSHNCRTTIHRTPISPIGSLYLTLYNYASSLHDAFTPSIPSLLLPSELSYLPICLDIILLSHPLQLFAAL
jgi:hypothetical protein